MTVVAGALFTAQRPHTSKELPFNDIQDKNITIFLRKPTFAVDLHFAHIFYKETGNCKKRFSNPSVKHQRN
jgi:hypothetical protein